MKKELYTKLELFIKEQKFSTVYSPKPSPQAKLDPRRLANRDPRCWKTRKVTYIDTDKKKSIVLSLNGDQLVFIKNEISKNYIYEAIDKLIIDGFSVYAYTADKELISLNIIASSMDSSTYKYSNLSSPPTRQANILDIVKA